MLIKYYGIILICDGLIQTRWNYNMYTVTILEYIGVFAFAVSGAYVAIEEKLDLLGIYILAMVTAMGGGIIRDIVTNVGIPVFFSSRGAMLIIIIAATMSIFIKEKWTNSMFFIVMDSLGLAAFPISSGIKAIDNNYNLLLFIFVTSITGVGGGLLRDIIINRKPVVFRKEIYCIAGIIGALVLWMTYPSLGKSVSVYMSLLTIVTIRMVSYVKGFNLPVILKS